MWLVSDLTPADLDDPQPGTVIAGRIEADNLGAPFRLGALLTMLVLGPDAPASTGQLYILDDGSDVAIVRMQDHSPDLLIVDQFTDAGTIRRRALGRRRWQMRALLMVK